MLDGKSIGEGRKRRMSSCCGCSLVLANHATDVTNHRYVVYDGADSLPPTSWAFVDYIRSDWGCRLI